MIADVRVVRGEPDDDELAALVAGLAAGSGDHVHAAADEVHAPRLALAVRRWRQAATPLTDPLTPAPDAWRWSAQLAGRRP